MKLLLLVVLLFLGALCEIRMARVQYIEKCDKRYTPADCSAYANVKSRSRLQCHSFTVSKSARAIYWEECGKIHCHGNTQLVKEDPSKPYPECCEHCEIVEPVMSVV